MAEQRSQQRAIRQVTPPCGEACGQQRARRIVLIDAQQQPVAAGFDMGIDKFKALIREAVEESDAR